MPPIVTPKGQAVPPTESVGGTSPVQQSARERAMARLMGNAPQAAAADAQTSPVQNPSKVSPEEIGALATTPVEGQNDTSVTPSEDAPKASDPAEVTQESKEAPLSAQYAQLARQEKALRQQAKALKAREDAIKAKETAASTPQPAQGETLEQFKVRFAKDPLVALRDVGMSYDDLTQRALNAPSPEQQAQQEYMERLEAKIAALEEAQGKVTKSFEDNQKSAYQQAVNQIRNETKSLVAQGEDFETIRETNSVDDVVDLIERTFKEDGVLMTVEEAAKAVEEHLVEEAMKIARLKKIQNRLKPATPAPAPKSASAEAPKQPQMKTLTNNLSTQRPLTAKERALLAFEGKLK